MVSWDLDDTVLKSYIDKFYGQGSYDAKYWFVGMEFGGGGSVEEIVTRIGSWHQRDEPEVEDVVGPNGEGGSRWFRGTIPLQPTWAKIIRVVLSAEGHTPTTDQMRAYQKDKLGRAGGLDLILELLPLPSPGLGSWLFYPEYSRIPYLSDRETYTNHVAPLRIEHIRQRIAEHSPRAVICYGASYTHWWSRIAGAPFQPSGIDKVAVASNGGTLFVVMQHPVARGLNNAYFEAVGRLVAESYGS